MERLTLAQARARVESILSHRLCLGAPRLTMAQMIDWSEPGDSATAVERAADDFIPPLDMRQEIADVLRSYQAHLDYTAGQDAMADQWSAHLRAERAARKKAGQAIHWIHAGHGWHVARLGRKYIAKCRVNGIFGTLEIRSQLDVVVATLDAPGSIEAASRKIRAWLRTGGR